MTTVGELSVLVSADISGLRAGLAQADQLIEATARKFEGFMSSLQTLGPANGPLLPGGDWQPSARNDGSAGAASGVGMALPVLLDLAPALRDPLLFRAALSQTMQAASLEPYAHSAVLDTLLSLLSDLRPQIERFIDDALIAPLKGMALLDLKLWPGKIDISAIAAAIQTQLNGISTHVGNPDGVQQAATGGFVANSGLAYLHAGEVILNHSQQADLRGSRGKGLTVENVYMFGNDIGDLYDLLQEEARKRG